MNRWWECFDLRTIVTIIALDALTYILVFWVMFSAAEPIVESLDPTVGLGIMHVANAVRLATVGMFAARALRRRRGMAARTDALPSVALGAAITLTLGLLLGVLGRMLVEMTGPSMIEYLVAIAECMVFPLLGVVFVMPGEAENPFLFRQHA